MEVGGLGFRGKVNQIKATTSFHLCPGWWSLSVFFICVLGGGRLMLEHNGSNSILVA